MPFGAVLAIAALLERAIGTRAPILVSVHRSVLPRLEAVAFRLVRTIAVERLTLGVTELATGRGDDGLRREWLLRRELRLRRDMGLWHEGRRRAFRGRSEAVEHAAVVVVLPVVVDLPGRAARAVLGLELRGLGRSD